MCKWLRQKWHSALAFRRAALIGADLHADTRLYEYSRDFLYEEESYKIRGACFAVWNELGSAFKESAIDRALTKELLKRGLLVEDQKRIAIIYHGEKIGTYIPDKVVNSIIIIELKRKSYLTKQDIKNF